MNVCESSYFYGVLNTEDVMFVRQVPAVIAVKILLAIIAVLLNILTIIMMWKLEIIPYGTRLLLLNFSGVNFLIGLLGQPMHLAFLVLLIKGNTNCTIIKISDTIFFALWISSLLTLVGAASERYVSIFCPFFHQRLVLGSKIRVSIIVLWVCAITVACSTQINETVAYYLWLSWIIFYILACALIMLFYIILYFLAYKIRCRIRKEELQFHNRASANKRSTNTTAILPVLTLICYLPFVIILQVHEFSDNITLNSQTFLWMETLALASSAFDPIVYCLTNKAIRKAVFCVFTKMRHAS